MYSTPAPQITSNFATASQRSIAATTATAIAAATAVAAVAAFAPSRPLKAIGSARSEEVGPFRATECQGMFILVVFM
jgi:hypothetical protein